MKEVFRKKGYILGIAGIVTVWMIFMFCFADMQSFWMDDIAQIDIAWQHSFKDLIKENMSVDNNPPLSHILSSIWIRIVPYGTGWLKLFNILWSGAGIFVCGICGRKMRDELAGITATVLCCSTYGMIVFSAYTFRPYGMLFFLSIFTFYMYMERREKGSLGIRISHMISLIALVYTHYFGILICCGFALCDLVLLCKKKVKVYELAGYGVALLSILPWLLGVMSNSLIRLETFWPEKPTFASIPEVIYELMGYNRGMEYLVILGLIGTLFLILFKKKYLKNQILVKIGLFVPFFTIGIVFFFSRYSTKFTSLFVARYFICAFPFMMLIVGVFYSSLIEWLVSIIRNQYLIKLGYTLIGIGFSFCILFNARNVYKISQGLNQPFEEVANYLMDQEDIHKSETLVFCTNRLHLQRGWEYYLTHKEERKGVAVTWHQLNEADLIGKNKVYLVTLQWPVEQKVLELLKVKGFQLEKEDSVLPIQIYER